MKKNQSLYQSTTKILKDFYNTKHNSAEQFINHAKKTQKKLLLLKRKYYNDICKDFWKQFEK